MSEEYWEGGTWVYQSNIVNGAGGGGTVSAEVVPGGGNELEILYGRLTNGDSSYRTATIRIEDDADNFLATVATHSLSAGHALTWPVTDEHNTNNMYSGATRLILSGDMVLHMELASVAASQDGFFGLTCRVRGGVPTVTEVGNSTPTITVNTERVF